MRFTVPKFIEHEAKIVGPLTFRQFIFVGIAGAICFVFYFTLPFSIFLISCLVLGGGALAFAFLRVGGRSLSSVLGSFLRFNLTPKIYIWRKIKIPIKKYIVCSLHHLYTGTRSIHFGIRLNMNMKVWHRR